MYLDEIKKNWDAFGKADPLWAINTHPDKKDGQWNEKEFFEIGEKEMEEQFLYLDQKGIPVNHARALDFGCGVGRITQPLARRFDEVEGVDCARSMIEKANSYNNHPGNCRYTLNERSDLSIFPDNHFDFIYSIWTLQHMPPELSFIYIREFVRTLAPGGVAVFQLPGTSLSRFQAFNRHIPLWIKQLYGKFKFALSGPYMEMYGADPGEVEAIIESSGGELTDKTQWRMGRIWINNRYYVTKSG